MSQWEHKLKKIILVAVVFILFVIFSFLITRPAISTISQIKKQAQMFELNVKEFLALELRRDSILNGYTQIEKYIFSKPKSDQEINADLLKALERATLDANLSVVNLSPEEVVAEKNNKLYIANLKAEGSIQEVVNFISRMNDSDLLLKIERLMISARGNDSDKMKVDFRISLSVL